MGLLSVEKQMLAHFQDKKNCRIKFNNYVLLWDITYSFTKRILDSRFSAHLPAFESSQGCSAQGNTLSDPVK